MSVEEAAPWEAEGGIDLGGIDENAAPPPFPAGQYQARCVEATDGKSQRTNKPMITLKFKINDPEFADDENIFGRTVYRYLVYDSDLGKQQLKKAIIALNPEMANTRFNPKTDTAQVFQGQDCRLKIASRQYEGRPVPDVKDILPLDDAGGFFGGEAA